MADAAQLAQLKQELRLLQSCQASIAAHEKLLQTMAARNSQSLPEQQWNSVKLTFSLIPKTCPVVAPTINNVAAIAVHLAAAHIIVAARITSVTSLISQNSAPALPPVSTPTQSITVHEQTADSSLSAATLPKPYEPKIREIRWRLLLRTLFGDSGALTVGIVGFIISLGALISTVIDAPKKFSPHPNYDSQLTALDKTKDAIQSLIGFIDDQKKQIQLSQNAVDALKTEEGRIHPLVEADRKVIDSLFAVQEQRNQNAQSHERLVGFWQGVLASLVATILSAFGAMLYKRRVRPKASSVQ